MKTISRKNISRKNKKTKKNLKKNMKGGAYTTSETIYEGMVKDINKKKDIIIIKYMNDDGNFDTIKPIFISTANKKNFYDLFTPLDI